MQKLIASSLPLFTAGLVVLTLAGCSPEAKKNRYLEQAERNFSSGNYDEAEIAYKNVLQIENLNAQAIGRLGLLYSDQGRIGPAISFVVKGRELQPDNLDLRLRYAQLSLAIGNLKDARTEADFILDRRPQDPDAPLLLAATIAQSQDIATTRARLEALPRGAPTLTALGSIELRQGHIEAAQSLLTQALAADPKFVGVHTVLGSLHWMQKDTAKAEQAFKQAADGSPVRSPRRTQYAQFKVQTGDPAAGRSYLEEIVRTAPNFLPASTMLAELALLEKKYDECAGIIARITSRDAQNLDALFIRGRLELARGNPAKAIEEFERLLVTYPRAPQIHHHLGLAHLAVNDATKGAASLKQALALAPGAIDTSLILANLHLRTGNPSPAVALLKPVVQQRPDNVQARLLLAEAYRQQKNFDDALAVYAQLEKDFPGKAQTSLLTGLTWLQKNQPAKARTAFTEALERAPGLIPALERLVALDLQEKQLDTATRRVETELLRNPGSAGVHVLLAKICMAIPDTARAEVEFKKAIELQPDQTEAYYLLARLYLGTNHEQKALANLQAVVSRNPSDIGAFMLIGMIHEQQKNYAGARDAYEKILGVNPSFTHALNNVAYLYSEHFNEPEKALAAAQKARELLPQEPHAADTLGWIVYKKGQYRWALSLLEESAAKLPDEPEVHYHLGMARYMSGLDAPARLALQHALDLGKDFPGIAETRRRLALLDFDPRTAGAEARALLERALAEQPGDPVALDRLAALQEREGALDQAVATQLKAAKANPTVATPLLRLARLYAAGKDTAKALETAKAARKLAPDDPETARILGQIAYRAGDFVWAASLLQEAARRIADDPGLRYEEAEALYSVGRVAEARASMQAALTLADLKDGNDSPREFADRTRQAKRFIEMIDLSATPAPAAVEKVTQLLEAEPDHVPALMAMAAINEQRAATTAAQSQYEKVLARFPDFAPAKLRLAVLGAAQPKFDEKAYTLAQQARSVYPDDPDLAKALGILTYRKGGEPNRAVILLKQSAANRIDDPELLYYLGMAQLQAKDPVGGRQSLQKALQAGLPAALEFDARKALGSSK